MLWFLPLELLDALPPFVYNSIRLRETLQDLQPHTSQASLYQVYLLEPLELVDVGDLALLAREREVEVREPLLHARAESYLRLPQLRKHNLHLLLLLVGLAFRQPLNLLQVFALVLRRQLDPPLEPDEVELVDEHPGQLNILLHSLNLEAKELLPQVGREERPLLRLGHFIIVDALIIIITKRMIND